MLLVKHLVLCLLCILLKSMSNKECCRPDDCPKCHNRISLHRKPHKKCQYDGNNSIKPDSLPLEEFFSMKAVDFRLHKQPVKKQEEKEHAATHEQDWRG